MISKRFQRRDDDVLAAHLKVLAQLLSRVTAAKTIGPQYRKRPGYELSQLVGVSPLIIGCGNEGADAMGQLLC